MENTNEVIRGRFNIATISTKDYEFFTEARKFAKDYRISHVEIYRRGYELLVEQEKSRN